MSWLSSILGLDSSHNQGVAQTNANAYQGQAAAGYGNLAQQGQAQTNEYNANYIPLLQKFGSYAGLGGSGLNAGGISNVNPTTGQTATAQANAQNGMASDPANNPYTLDQNQQGLLNQQTASLAKQHQQATASFEQELQAHGISDPRALQVGKETLDEHFASLKATTETQFYEQVKQDKMKALQSLISEMEQYGQQGISETEASAGGLGSLGGAQQNQANIQQQNAQSQQSGLAQLLSFGFGGGFGGSSSAGATGTSTASAGVSGNSNPFDGYMFPI